MQLAQSNMWRIAKGAAIGAIEDVPILGGAVRGGIEAAAESGEEDLGDEDEEEEE